MLESSSYAGLSREELLAIVEQYAEQGVRINFAGKDSARQIAREVRPRTLRRNVQLSVGTDEQQSENQLIEGENLQAMVSLYRMRGQVDFVLADPPYNTGNDFRYNDRWEKDPNDSGLGRFISSEDPARHTKWMRFMWPRLQTMKTMLKPRGVLAICIDHRELFRLGAMLDEIFGEKNRVAIINWQKAYAPKNNAGARRHVSTATEYVLVYANDIDAARTNLLDRTELMNSRYGSIDGDARAWKGADFSGPGATTHPGQVYGVQNPFTGSMVYPPQGRCWSGDRARVLRMLEAWGSSYTKKKLDDGYKEPAFVIDGPLAAAAQKAREIYDRGSWPTGYWTGSGSGTLAQKKYIDEVRQGFIPMTYWSDEDYESPEILDSTSWHHEQSGHTQSAANELNAIVGRGHNFDTVKPLKLFSKLIQLWCPPAGLVLDPFAGTGTTGHAVMALNEISGASRRFVLIEQGRPERGDSYASTLTSERLRRVITGHWASGNQSPVPGGFAFNVLGKRVNAAAVLAMERSMMADTVIASHFDASRRGGPSLVRISDPACRYLVAHNSEKEGFFLIWDGKEKSPVFDEDVYEEVVAEALSRHMPPVYHVYARFNLFQSDDVRFYQIPNRILLDFGLSEVSDAFNGDPDDDESEEREPIADVVVVA